MKINIKLMTEEAYRTLLKNYEKVYSQILNHPSDSSWLEGFLGFSPFETKIYEIEELNLKYDKDYTNVAVENGIELYEKLNHLPQYILSDAKFWLWVLFEYFYKQAQIAVEFSKKTIKTRWFIRNSRRDLMLGVVSRQFYKCVVAFDDLADDPYHLAKFILLNHNPYKNITMRNIGMLKNVVIPYLKINKETLEKNNISLNDEYCSGLLKEASMIGSVTYIDLIPAEEIYQKLKETSDKFIADYKSKF